MSDDRKQGQHGQQGQHQGKKEGQNPGHNPGNTGQGQKKDDKNHKHDGGKKMPCC